MKTGQIFFMRSRPERKSLNVYGRVVPNVTHVLKPAHRVVDFIDYKDVPTVFDVDGYLVVWNGTVSRRTGKQINELVR